MVNIRRPDAAGVILLMIVVAVAAQQRSVQAQQRDPREVEAKTACLAGHSDRGIELLAQLYAETNDPTYIYNQGRCFEQDGKAGSAITRFREYLRKSPGIGADERAQVQEHIKELEAQQQQPAAPGTPSAPPSSSSGPTTPPVIAPAGAVPAAGAVPSQPATLGGISADASTERPGHGLRIAGIVAAGFGVVALGTAVYMHSRAVTLSNEVTAAANDGRYDAGKYQEGQRAESLQWVGYSIGVAALLTGGVLYLLGANEHSAAADSVTVIACPTPDGRLVTSLRMAF